MGAASSPRSTRPEAAAAHASPPRMNLNPGGRTDYMNMGFWTADTATLDAAGEAMARLVARAADLRSGDRVLDVGCGRGEGAFLWHSAYGCERLVGIDIDPDHIARARARAAALGDRLEFRTGSATSLDADGDTFDKVICIEASHGFDTREAFLDEAFRVLRPGGFLAVTDILPLAGAQVRHFAMRPANIYARDAFATKLAGAGFVDVAVESIREHVIDPFNRHLARLRPSRTLRGRIQMFHRRRLSARLDYVLATARKPADS